MRCSSHLMGNLISNFKFPLIPLQFDMEDFPSQSEICGNHVVYYAATIPFEFQLEQMPAGNYMRRFGNNDFSLSPFYSQLNSWGISKIYPDTSDIPRIAYGLSSEHFVNWIRYSDGQNIWKNNFGSIKPDYNNFQFLTCQLNPLILNPSIKYFVNAVSNACPTQSPIDARFFANFNLYSEDYEDIIDGVIVGNKIIQKKFIVNGNYQTEINFDDSPNYLPFLTGFGSYCNFDPDFTDLYSIEFPGSSNAFPSNLNIQPFHSFLIRDKLFHKCFYPIENPLTLTLNTEIERNFELWFEISYLKPKAFLEEK